MVTQTSKTNTSSNAPQEDAAIPASDGASRCKGDDEQQDAGGDLAQRVALLSALLTKHDLTEIEIENHGERLRVSRQGGGVPLSALSMPARADQQASTAVSSDEKFVTASQVGTFYRAPSPDAPPFVSEGQRVTKGTTLCILEAMKVMNELKAEYDLQIVEVLVENAEAVEYGAPLFRVEVL
ncbi:MAG: acetyl-CoA carboxylase biotin carboxyl carrier protein [Deltaproteobacteria bacterium]|nr:acetyl-CoA carboxylase biotin carboxyl carrier protein [Deltaproteobacteria bacterium]